MNEIAMPKWPICEREKLKCYNECVIIKLIIRSLKIIIYKNMEGIKTPSKKVIAWSLIVVVAVILVAVAYFLMSSGGSQNTNPVTGGSTPTQNTGITQTTAEVTDITNKAVSSVDPSICAQIQDATAKQGCLDNVNAINITRKAIDSRDSSVCSQITEATPKQACLNDVIITKASDAMDPTICNAISDTYTKTACTDNVIFAKARAAKNPSLCLSLQEKARISSCQSTAK